jgi:hypothetical protein
MITLQSIIQCPYEDIYEDVNLGFLIVALSAIEMPSPTFNLLATTVMNKYLYHHLFKVEDDVPRIHHNVANDTPSSYNDEEWVIYKERIDMENGNKKVITFKLNTKTKERIDLEEEILEAPDSAYLEDIFNGFLSQGMTEEVPESEL